MLSRRNKPTAVIVSLGLFALGIISEFVGGANSQILSFLEAVY